MAIETPKPPEGFQEVSRSGDTDRIELTSGETLLGPVLDIYEGEGEYGPWFDLTIKDADRGIVQIYAKDEVKIAVKNGNLERGDTVWIARGEEEQEIDGGSSYLPTLCRIQGDS